MSVTSITENHTRWGASEQTESGAALRVFDVEFDDGDQPIYRQFLAKRASASGITIPQVWQAHPADPWLYCVRVESRPKGDSTHLYEVTCQYESVQDPLTQDPIVEWSGVMVSEPIDRDRFGEPIQNSSHETFDPPIQQDFEDLVLRVRRNEASFDPIVAAGYKWSVNSDQFAGFPPGEARMRIFEGRYVRAGGLYFWEVQYEIHFRQGGWKVPIFDKGFRTIKLDSEGAPDLDSDGNYQYVTVKDTDGNPMREPVMLDGQGQRLPKVREDDPVKLEFELLQPLEYNALGLYDMVIETPGP